MKIMTIISNNCNLSMSICPVNAKHHIPASKGDHQKGLETYLVNFIYQKSRK
jgi:hypothetical protein